MEKEKKKGKKSLNNCSPIHLQVICLLSEKVSGVKIQESKIYIQLTLLTSEWNSKLSSNQNLRAVGKVFSFTNLAARFELVNTA